VISAPLLNFVTVLVESVLSVETYSVEFEVFSTLSGLNIFDWAKFRKRKGAIRIHTKLNHNGNIPNFLTITDGKCSDIRAARDNFKFIPDSKSLQKVQVLLVMKNNQADKRKNSCRVS